MSHKTVSDLVFLAQHELDLYHEGEETDIRTPKQLAAVKAFVMKYRTPPARKNPESSPQFEFHLKPPGWTGAPCPICGCDAKNLRAKHRALKADEAHQWGARYIKRVKVCFGTDFSDEAIKTNPAGGLPLSFDVKDGGRWYDVIARHDGAAVGNIRVRRSEHLPKTKPDPRTPCYQVSDIEVVERMRRRGVATALYEAAAKVAFSEGFSMCSDFAQNLGQDAEAAWDSLRKKGIAYWEVPGNVDENFDYGRYVIPKVKA
jgi:GNAT superfamily N-acetyltransferase